jgi:hypothetical protein
MGRSGGLRGTTVIWLAEFVRSSGAIALTLSMTFSSELGQSIAKQTKRRSVSGYESGRRRSYSSWPAVSHRASSTIFPLGWWVGYVI